MKDVLLFKKWQKKTGIKRNLIIFRNSATFLTAIDKNSPAIIKNKKLSNSTIMKELDEMLENDDEIKKHKMEIEKIKYDQK